ncbi:putative envelope protein [Escherichia coli]|uniref:Putative envelope protein n=1 Tax=Escherichia coli TaxID=562 RepID=A0A2X3M4E7_ECOLX|nr:putative envelope protein [Escherichia coli]
MGYKYPRTLKDITIPFDNSLLFTESIQNTTQIFPR